MSTIALNNRGDPPKTVFLRILPFHGFLIYMRPVIHIGSIAQRPMFSQDVQILIPTPGKGFTGIYDMSLK